MTKVATISSLVRKATRSEESFYETIQEVFEEQDVERIAEFFDKLNIPRSVGADSGLLNPIPPYSQEMLWVTNLTDEGLIGDGIQRYLDRHVRKIKWHAGHPSAEGIENVLLVLRESMFVTTLRLKRLQLLLDNTDELTPIEWAISREQMNRAYLSFRNFINLTATAWMDAVSTVVPREELTAALCSPELNFYELIDDHIRMLDESHDRIEVRRLELTVVPEGFPPVKPPNYFGGDLLGRGPWKQYWKNLNERAHQFRESVG